MEQADLTFVYKTNPTKNSLDIFLPPSSSHSHLKALLYFHGGGLTAGTRKSWFPSWMKERAMQAGWIFMSADYSLLCPATSHHLLQDIIDLFSYIDRDMNNDLELLGKTERIASNSIAVAGSSAGGLCAYLAALHAKPRPKAVLSLYGMGGDFLTPQYISVKTKPFFLKREILKRDDFEEYLYPFPPSLKMISESERAFFPSDNSAQSGLPSNLRMPLCRLLLQLGVFLDYHTGEHGPSLSETLRSAMDKRETGTQSDGMQHLIPKEHWKLFPQFLVGPGFPPTFLIHGGNDTAVLPSESKNMKRLLTEHGVRHELRIAKGEEHSFDYKENATVKYAGLLDEAFNFLQNAFEKS